MYQDFFKNLQATDTILTVNQRLAAFLQAEFIHYQQSQHSTWQTADILPLTSWLKRCWLGDLLNNTETWLLLSPQQEQLIWEEIIQEKNHYLLSQTATAQLAQQAWQLTQQWHVDFEQSLFKQTEDSRTWQQWAYAFTERCIKNRWLDNASLGNHLIELAKKNKFTLPTKIFLLGFDELNPQYQKLLDSLNIPYESINCEINNSTSYRLGLQDTETEILTMARWAYQHWQQGITSIGCIVPNLTQIRNQVIHVFNEVFCKTEEQPFNISAGINFADYPLIQTALTLLNLPDPVSINQISSVLRSPYLGHAEQEMTARAQLDVILRNNNESYLHLHQIMMAAKKHNCPQLAEQLQNYLHLKIPSSKENTFFSWTQYFIQQLHAFGWPGERSLNSLEYQLFERWKKSLEEYATFDIVLSNVEQRCALKHLNTLVNATVFQPQTTNKPSIQILGLLESSGLHFEQLWIMNLDDTSWPPIPRPNPFIPYKLQRQLNMPHATSERELNFSQLITDRLTRSAKEIILSYPQQREDQTLRPSALIKFAKTIELNLPTYESPAEKKLATGQFEFLEDDYAPTFNSNETISGGTAIFKHQANCPFQAFARFRLHAQTVEQPQPGLNHKERGSLLHKALETVWNLIGTQEKLIHYTDHELEKIIQQAIRTTLTSFIQKKPLTFKNTFTEIEEIRLQKLLTEWLKHEKNRSTFSVLATEKIEYYQLANIPLKLRVDRIDQLPNGGHLIIDYKTGYVSTNDWLGERPDEPQLPIYCLADVTQVKGLAFAQIRSNKMQFKGISAENLNIHGITPESNWNELVQQWQQVLEKLGQQFHQGYAKVDPKEEKQTCRYCDLQPLCRVNDPHEHF